MKASQKEALQRALVSNVQKRQEDERGRALREYQEQQKAEREKMAHLRALREARDRRVGAMVQKALNRKPRTSIPEHKRPLSNWLEDQEKLGRRK